MGWVKSWCFWENIFIKDEALVWNKSKPKNKRSTYIQDAIKMVPKKTYKCRAAFKNPRQIITWHKQGPVQRRAGRDTEQQREEVSGIKERQLIVSFSPLKMLRWQTVERCQRCVWKPEGLNLFLFVFYKITGDDDDDDEDLSVSRWLF